MIYYSNEIYHHGVKGQKWGVQNGPPYPIKKDKINSNFTKRNNNVLDVINKGEVIVSLNKDKQIKHLKENAIKDGRSYIFGNLEDCQKLINKLYATSDPKERSKEFDASRKEFVRNDEPIGIHVNPKTGKRTKTNKGVIIYSKSGTHIYPANPYKNKKGEKK